MKKAILLFLLLGWAGVYAQQTIKWPHQKRALIVLTYDDALLSQLNIAVPQLKAAGLKATFFLTGDVNYTTIPLWRNLSKKGFELGNHTMFHPCANTDDNPVSSSQYTPYGMIREIDDMNHLLFAIDGKTSRTYAYPCTETTVGGKDYVDTLKRYGLVKYARIGGDAQAIITDFAHLDKLRIPSFGLVDGTTGDQLVDFVKKVEQQGGMGIIMIHGVGGDYITISAQAHQQLLNYLAANKQYIWVTTLQQGMDYVTAAGAAQ